MRDGLDYVKGFRWRDKGNYGWDWTEFQNYLESHPELTEKIMVLLDQSVGKGVNKIQIDVTPSAYAPLPDHMLGMPMSFSVELAEDGFAEGYTEDVYQLIANGRGF